jgi:hypothetical protein
MFSIITGSPAACDCNVLHPRYSLTAAAVVTADGGNCSKTVTGSMYDRKLTALRSYH